MEIVILLQIRAQLVLVLCLENVYFLDCNEPYLRLTINHIFLNTKNFEIFLNKELKDQYKRLNDKNLQLMFKYFE